VIDLFEQNALVHSNRPPSTTTTNLINKNIEEIARNKFWALSRAGEARNGAQNPKKKHPEGWF
jgi:hypothetical protein